jgi:hypothetical protein
VAQVVLVVISQQAQLLRHKVNQVLLLLDLDQVAVVQECVQLVPVLGLQKQVAMALQV